MTGAMYAAIAGLKTHMSKMNVIGNNIANVNTSGYKTQRTIFKDALYTMYSSGSNGTTTVGGRNPSQIGYGSQVSSIDLNMSTGTYAPGNPMDCMIYGDGFFLAGDKDVANAIDPLNPTSLKSLSLTRVGDMDFRADGYLVDGSGGCMYGFLAVGVDPITGDPIMSDQLVPIRLPRMEKVWVDAAGIELNPQPTPDAIPDDATEEYVIRWPQDRAVDENGAVTETAQRLVDYAPPADPDNPDAEVEPLPFVQLDGITIDKETGRISGTTKDTDEWITIGFLAVGNVTNPNGLTHEGGFYYSASDGAGDLQISMLGGVEKDLRTRAGQMTHVNGSLYAAAAAAAGLPEDTAVQSDLLLLGSAGTTELITGGLEGSNVDLATEISDMITTQRGYQANTRIITVTDTMLEELVNMKR